MKNYTLADIELAIVYFYVLVGMVEARNFQTIEYKQLVELAKGQYPENSHVAAAVPVSIGRRLAAMRAFTTQCKLPDLSALVVCKATGKNSDDFTKSFDGESVRQQIAEFDWKQAPAAFEQVIAGERLEFEQRKKFAGKSAKILNY